MSNNSIFDKEARLKIAEREREAEIYRLHNQLGYSDRRAMRWVWFIPLLVLLILILALL